MLFFVAVKLKPSLIHALKKKLGQLAGNEKAGREILVGTYFKFFGARLNEQVRGLGTRRVQWLKWRCEAAVDLA